LRLPEGVPCADTFRRGFARLEPEAFGRRFTARMQALAGSTGGEPVALDGETMRHAFDTATGTPALASRPGRVRPHHDSSLCGPLGPRTNVATPPHQYYKLRFPPIAIFSGRRPQRSAFRANCNGSLRRPCALFVRHARLRESRSRYATARRVSRPDVGRRGLATNGATLLALRLRLTTAPRRGVRATPVVSS
jgi:hypothetical protein